MRRQISAHWKQFAAFRFACRYPVFRFIRRLALPALPFGSLLFLETGRVKANMAAAAARFFSVRAIKRTINARAASDTHTAFIRLDRHEIWIFLTEFRRAQITDEMLLNKNLCPPKTQRLALVPRM